MENIKNVYNGSELESVLKEIIKTKEATTIIFHEDEYGFEDEDIIIEVTYNTSEDCFNVTTEGTTTRTFHSKWTFKDYVCTVCGW